MKHTGVLLRLAIRVFGCLLVLGTLLSIPQRVLGL